MEIKVYNMSNEEAGIVEVSETVFNAEYNEAIIHQVIVAQQANKRQGTKCTLTRTEVRGGGRKPWRQKGTGNARQGSRRAPQWIKGGVVFAPKPRDFSKKVNVKVKRAALKSALSKKLADGQLFVVEQLAFEPKTKNMANVLKSFDLVKRTLLVLTEEDTAARIAANNIPTVTTIEASLVNVYDLLANANCMMTKEAILAINDALDNKEEE